jgi:hypothetical protein
VANNTKNRLPIDQRMIEAIIIINSYINGLSGRQHQHQKQVLMVKYH